PKAKRSRRRPFERSPATTSISGVAVSSRRGFEFDFRKFYTALVAVVALVAVTWGLLEWVAVRNGRRVAESYVIPPPAPRVNTSASPTSTNRHAPIQRVAIQPEPVQAAPVQPEPVQAAPVQPMAVQPVPMRTDVVGTATAAALPERASAPQPKPQHVI